MLRVFLLSVLTGCTAGEVPSLDEMGVGPGTVINPLEALNEIQERPKCELPAITGGSGSAVAHLARTRPEALDGYDSINARFEVVAQRMPDVRACTPKPYTQELTHQPFLQGTPQAQPYHHFNTLTFVPDRHPDATSRARGDLYLHGTQGEGTYLVVRDLDFRKYLYQDIVLHDCAKTPQRCGSERLPGPNNVWRTAESVSETIQNQPFNSDVFACIRNVHGYFAEFNRITKKIDEVGTGKEASKTQVHLTNNCREPGNYELALVTQESGKVWGNHISLDMAFYGAILNELSVNYRALGTGVRIVGTERAADGSYQYETREEKSFPASCHIQNLAPYVGKAQRVLFDIPQPIDVALGPVPWTQYAGETQAKSGLKSDEGIVYVEVRSTQESPTGFRAPEFFFVTGPDGVTERHTAAPGEATWDALRARGSEGYTVHVPHTFATFKDIQEYPFQISAFEVDGQYLGRKKATRISERAARMYAFDYGFAHGWDQFEARVAIDKDGAVSGPAPRLEFRLQDSACLAASRLDCIQLIVGNIDLSPGDETHFVLGIGTQPLRDLYVNNVASIAQKYALTYDRKGHITDLATTHGLGMVYVRRGKGTFRHQYTLDLVSYERAVPVWRGTVTVPVQ